MRPTPVVVAGDTLPPLKIQLNDGTAVFDPTTADSVTVKVWQDEELIIDSPATSATSAGVVTYQWLDGDTDNPGPIKVRVVLEYVGHTETWPTSGYMIGTICAASPTPPPA